MVSTLIFIGVRLSQGEVELDWSAAFIQRNIDYVAAKEWDIPPLDSALFVLI